ncbi:MAG: leucine-rich repeat domain-containing protein [Prochloraceae cyanobacterium]|nr:leucine-rich repeat domain-containing protein [Prochloraceae cyanobacterium]
MSNIIKETDSASYVTNNCFADCFSLNSSEVANYLPEQRLLYLKQLENIISQGNKVWLFLTSNEIRDVTPLAQLSNLDSLYLSNNQIRDVTPLAQLSKLEFLELANNQIRDVSSECQTE